MTMCVSYFPFRPITILLVRPVMSNMVATRYMWLFKLRLIKIKYN